MKKYNVSLIAINQLRDKIDLGVFKPKATLKYLAQKELPGGHSLSFNSSQLLYLSSGKDIDDEYGFKGGSRVTIKAVKNKQFRPNLEFELVFSFNLGYSNFWSNYEFLKKINRIKSGAWCSLDGMSTPKFRQCDAFQLYKTNPEFKQLYDSHVKEGIQTEIIDRNKITYNQNNEDEYFM